MASIRSAHFFAATSSASPSSALSAGVSVLTASLSAGALLAAMLSDAAPQPASRAAARASAVSTAAGFFRLLCFMCFASFLLWQIHLLKNRYRKQNPGAAALQTKLPQKNEGLSVCRTATQKDPRIFHELFRYNQFLVIWSNAPVPTAGRFPG